MLNWAGLDQIKAKLSGSLKFEQDLTMSPFSYYSCCAVGKRSDSNPFCISPEKHSPFGTHPHRGINLTRGPFGCLACLCLLFHYIYGDRGSEGWGSRGCRPCLSIGRGAKPRQPRLRLKLKWQQCRHGCVNSSAGHELQCKKAAISAAFTSIVPFCHFAWRIISAPLLIVWPAPEDHPNIPFIGPLHLGCACGCGFGVDQNAFIKVQMVASCPIVLSSLSNFIRPAKYVSKVWAKQLV